MLPSCGLASALTHKSLRIKSFPLTGWKQIAIHAGVTKPSLSVTVPSTAHCLPSSYLSASMWNPHPTGEGDGAKGNVKEEQAEKDPGHSLGNAILTRDSRASGVEAALSSPAHRME